MGALAIVAAAIGVAAIGPRAPDDADTGAAETGAAVPCPVAGGSPAREAPTTRPDGGSSAPPVPTDAGVPDGRSSSDTIACAIDVNGVSSAGGKDDRGDEAAGDAGRADGWAAGGDAATRVVSEPADASGTLEN